MNSPHPSAEVHPISDRVVVVGAGPAGCTVSLLLADLGVPVTLLERHPGPHPLPRAVHLDDEVTRTLHRIGVSEGFLALSRPGGGLRLLDARHRVMAEFPRQMHVGRHGFPQANMFHQPELEDLMYARVDAHPLIDLHRNVEVTSLDGALDPFTAPPVRVRTRPADRPDTPGETFTGRLVLGCDGAGSIVRDSIGVTMEDLGFTERWLVVDIRTDTALDTWDGVEQVCDPARAATFMRVTGNSYRWEFQLHDGEDDADLTNPQALARLLGPWTGRATLDGLQIIRNATYTFRARIASRFRVGRVFLLGDAAHLTPPFIGQGLAAGLRDCDNLAWKIAHVLAGRAGESLLDTYDSERRPHARALVRKAVTVGWAMTGGQDRAAAVRRILAAVVCRSARLRDLLGDPATPILRTGALQRVPRRSRRRLGLTIGGLIPNPIAALADGTKARLDDVLGGRTTVLTARHPEPELVDLCRTYHLLLVRLHPPTADFPAAAADQGERHVDASGDEVPDRIDVWLTDTSLQGLPALLAHPELAVLVRPDRVVAATADRANLPEPPWSARTTTPVRA
jgi:3-(3-hydroxy-phenyl)propionate hydroxylase